jgi:hypothetical protein
MGSVTTEIKAAAAVVDEPAGAGVPVQAGPAGEQLVTAKAIAEALDPALVARLAAPAGAGVQLLGRGGVLQQLTKRFLEAALEAEMDAISATTSTMRPGATGATPATASAARRC